MRTTCHAGEAAEPDYIWQAIRDLNVDRIGHATNASKDSDLVHYLIENQIPIEMCLISNVKTNVVKSIMKYPIYQFYKKGMRVSVNTNDPKMFGTSLENEYLSQYSVFNLELKDIYNLAMNSINSA